MTTILAIETSCDETGIAILQASLQKDVRFQLLANEISSQIEIHKPWGGVYPLLAKREHQKNLIPVLKKCLKRSNLLNSLSVGDLLKGEKFKILNSIFEREPELLEKTINFLNKYQKPHINAIAVTKGPGLEPCLWVGINFARALSVVWNLPLIPVNHIEAHLCANFIGKNPESKVRNRNQIPKIEFPAMCLVVSGGHTELILMKDFRKYTLLGETRDDAAGECFDKVAKILGLGYPGGPAIAARATEHKTIDLEQKKRDRVSVKLPRPMMNSKDYDFSFSGLKTAVLYNFLKQPRKIQKNKEYIQAMAAETQQAIIDVLIAKTLRAAQDYQVKTIMLGGGVSANKELRKQFKEKIEKELPDVQYLIPDTQFSTDNAAMIAIAGFFHLKEKTKNIKKIKANANLRMR